MSDVSKAERLAWLRLYRSQNVGPVTFRRLIAKYKTAEKALEALPELNVRGGGKKKITIYSEEQALKEIASVKKLGGRFCLSCDDDYPDQLRATEDAPAVLTLLGEGDISEVKPIIGVVGARNASLNGRRFTEKLTKALGENNIRTISGLARGIDTAAHTGSLPYQTWAVVAGGVDIVYPKENQKLYDEINSNGGLIIAESPLGVSPRAQDFPRRNRIVSGLSAGVVVVEATVRSGSLITARLAAEQGRDVYAVPGFPGDPRAAGPNKLLKDGAILLERVEDVLEQLAQPRSMPNTLFDRIFEQDLFEDDREVLSEKDHDDVQDNVLAMLSHVPISVDEIVRTCDVSISGVQSVLLDLEIAGRLERLPGNRVGLINVEGR